MPQPVRAFTESPPSQHGTPPSLSSKLPSKQWAQVFESHGGEITFREIPVPEPQPDELLVNIKYTGVCHTDLHAWTGDWSEYIETVKPLVGGHEGVGEVVGLGHLVDTKNFRMGMKVGIPWINRTCGTCSYCISGCENLCPTPTLSGYLINGTFQQFARVQARQAIKIPDHCKLEEVAPIMCAGLTVYKALKVSEARPGQAVAITGAGGGLGSYAIQYAKAMGLDVIAIDTGADKKLLCMKLGADAFVDFATTKNLISEVKSHTKDQLGPQAAIVTAASAGPYNQATEYVRPSGTVVAVGLPKGKIQADIFDTVVRMVNIKGSYVGTVSDAQEAVDFFAKGKIRGKIEMRGLSELKGAYKDMQESKVSGRIVLDAAK